MNGEETKKRKIAILGSTGSIGTQTLEVIKDYPNLFEAEVLTANNNADLLIKQAIEFKPNAVVIGDEKQYKKVNDALWNYDIKTYAGEEALAQIVEMESIDLVLTALVGYAGLLPTINAIKCKKPIALANKETLVVAGDIVSKLANENNVPILPVDSEHSAIFQCLVGEFHNPIEKIILTASGGPFRKFSIEELSNVSPAQALKHPNWDMGAKITVDSASMMNKGLEVIEAKWLFDLKANQIDVIIHPQSIIHSIVQFEDGSMKAQMGLPDMKLPIHYAMNYPKRVQTNFKRFNFIDYPALQFEQVDLNKFQNLALAYKALEKEGTAACALNAANEISNAAFLANKIGFLEIAEINAEVMEKATFIKSPSLTDYIHINQEARNLATAMIKSS